MSFDGASSSSAALTDAPSSDMLISDVTPTIFNPFCTINVKTHMPITLELHWPNFTQWTTFFKAMVGKFGLIPFLDPIVLARPSDLVWE
jgi:hypothetical protein